MVVCRIVAATACLWIHACTGETIELGGGRLTASPDSGTERDAATDADRDHHDDDERSHGDERHRDCDDNEPYCTADGATFEDECAAERADEHDSYPCRWND